MSGDSTGFVPHFQRLLGHEQRRAVLDVIGQMPATSSTLGEIVDAADALGWHEGLGQLRLVDLAEALLGTDDDGDAGRDMSAAIAPPAADTPAATKPAVTTSAVTKATKAAATRSTAAKSAATKSTATKSTKAKSTAAKSTAAKSTATKSTKAKARGKAKVPTQDAFDERMSLEEAVAAFVPLIESIGEATMQDLEEATGLARRKLRFHVGQLVKHGHIQRHGMGRGTFYSV